MANLALDFGNTFIKAASFTEGELTQLKVFKGINELLAASDYIISHKNAIIASVTQDHSAFLNSYKNKLNCLLFSSSTPIPIANSYQSPATLGSDRIAASIGAYALYPNTNVLTIDCGTCIKYNFVSSANAFLGGGISPGLNLRFKSLNDHTAQLPIVALDEHFSKLIGENTQESILSGVVNGTVKEIEGMIAAYETNYSGLKVLITGGDGNFFAKRLKNSIFAHPDLLLKGLNKILEFNLEKK